MGHQAGEHLVAVDVREQPVVPVLVVSLDLGDLAVRIGDVGEALGRGLIGEVGVELAPLHLLACGGGGEVLGGRADHAGRVGSP